MFVLLTAACNNSADEPVVEDTVAADLSFHWEAADTGTFYMVKMPGGGPDSLTPSSIIQFLNRQYPNVQLVYKKIAGDTLYIAIPEATYLTQQMGSYGSKNFLAEAVFDLTEITGINFINFDFEEGDHAMPGTMTRSSFKE